MQRSSFISNSKIEMMTNASPANFIVKLLLFIVGMVAIDQSVGLFARYGEREDFTLFMNAKKTFDRSKNFDAWVIGDSLAADDIVPSAMNQTAGFDTFNWGVYGSSPVEWRQISNDLLETSENPDLAIIVVNHIMFDRPGQAHSYTYELLSNWKARLALIQVTADHQDLGALFVSGRKRSFVRSAFLRIIRREPPVSRTVVGTDNGYLISTDKLTGTPDMLQYSGIYNERIWNDQAFHFRAMLDEYQKHGVETHLVFAPIHPYAVDDLIKSDRYQRIVAFLEETGRPVYNSMERYDELKLEGADFKDVIHMNNSGATKLSYAVAVWLSDLEA